MISVIADLPSDSKSTDAKATTPSGGSHVSLESYCTRFPSAAASAFTTPVVPELSSDSNRTEIKDLCAA